MQKRWFISFFSLVLAQLSIAQQNNYWYFGKRAAIDFTTGNPRPVHNSAMDANEGSASICDNNGNLLFYTNGITVYNKNHQVMLNGDGLLGNISTVQTAIVPLPGSTTIFYIFTTDAIENGYANGYNYSVVDMSRDGGKGEVISKNVLFNASCTERIAAARHADGISVWIITNDNNSNVFKAWLINCNGFSQNPVVSTVGDVLASTFLMNTGMLKVSPDGKQICQTHFPYLDDGTGAIPPNYFQLFDFDAGTGIISNARQINTGDAKITSCEFSSNSQLLYVTRPYEKKIDQFECKLPSTGAIIASRFTFSTDDKGYYGIQLAPDQKIYLATPGAFLGAITRPNVKGAGCNFVKNQLDINEDIGGIAYAGFPNFINDLSFDGNHNFSYVISDSCSNTVQFNASSNLPGASFSWDFGDGGNSSLQNPSHSFTGAASSFVVKLKIYPASGCGVIERTKNVIPKGLLLNAAFDVKVVCDSGYVRFTNKSTYSPDSALIRYSWDFGDGNGSTQLNPVHTYAAPGNYNVRLNVQTSTACLDKSLSQNAVVTAVTVQAPPDQQIDVGQSVQLIATATGASSYSWSPSAGLSNPSIPNPIAKPRRSTMYIITAFNVGGCKDVDSVFVKVIPVPGIRVPTGFTPNNDGKNDILRPSISDEYILHEFAIYNRWGQKVYATSEKETGWNGKINGLMQDAGVYVYIISVTNTDTNQKEERKGSFVLIR